MREQIKKKDNANYALTFKTEAYRLQKQSV